MDMITEIWQTLCPEEYMSPKDNQTRLNEEFWQ
jgi:hypothetical protein